MPPLISNKSSSLAAPIHLEFGTLGLWLYGDGKLSAAPHSSAPSIRRSSSRAGNVGVLDREGGRGRGECWRRRMRSLGSVSAVPALELCDVQRGWMQGRCGGRGARCIARASRNRAIGTGQASLSKAYSHGEHSRLDSRVLLLAEDVQLEPRPAHGYTMGSGGPS